MSIKIESFASILVVAVGVWYLATRTNLGKSFTGDVLSMPSRITGYFDRPGAVVRMPPEAVGDDRYRRDHFR